MYNISEGIFGAKDAVREIGRVNCWCEGGGAVSVIASVKWRSEGERVLRLVG